MKATHCIRELIEKGETDREKLLRAAMKACGVSRDYAGAAYRRVTGELVRPRQKDRKISRDLKTVDVEALVSRERLDPARIVREGLRHVGENVVDDDVFRRFLELSTMVWADVRNLEEFRECQVVLPSKKRVWALEGTRDYLLSLDGVRELDHG